jgi:peptidoglycan/xylan/chitin deacetylase (PgdA/CDA1 family)
MISDDKPLHIKHLYGHKNIRQFNNDLDFLLTNFSPINLEDILNFLKRDQLLPKNPILLTFDDGFREMHDVVAPILFRKGISATFFVNSGFTDNKDLCYQHKVSILVEHLQRAAPSSIKEIQQAANVKTFQSKDVKSSLLSIKYKEKEIVDKIAALMEIDFDDYLVKNKPYLTSEQIAQLIRNGFFIGAHSIDHPLYSSLSLEEQLQQTKESISFIKEKFLLNYGVFAFPHSDSNVSKAFFEEIYRNGLIDISFGTDGIICDYFKDNIQRFSLEKPLMPAKYIIAYQFAKKIYRIMKSNDKIIRNLRL